MISVTLPPLREELSLHDGPSASDGSPTWSLQDPVRNKFFRIDWPTFLILSHWHLGNPRAICQAAMNEAPIDLRTDDVEAVTKFLAQSELLQCADSGATRRLLLTARGTRESWWKWLLHHYLFFRIPLLRPDAWLTRLSPHVALFYSSAFLKLTLLALGIGLVQTARQWTQFQATFVDSLSWSGLAAYAGVLVLIKMLHELGHAFTAKRFGCRVPTMGVAFLVMWPVAYTDVNETWKLAERRQRMAVGAAGVATELAVAAWATLAWAMLPDGTLRGAAFMLAAVTWISTIAVNASPFMRFDGYFLLSDWLDIPNLHERAFALARWRMRESLFALGEEPPEHFSRGRTRFLIAFAFVTWAYRLGLFLGIAVLVYRHTFKALGVVLFAVEIGWFVAIPIKRELQEWMKRRTQILKSHRARIAGAAALLLIALAFVPIDLRVTSQGVLRPARSLEIYVPAASILKTAPAAPGAVVAAGTTIAELSSPDIDHRAKLAQAHRARVDAQLRAASLDETLQGQTPVLREQLAAIDAEISGIEEEVSRLAPRAPFSGRLVDPLPDLHAGDTLARNQRLATLVDTSVWEVRAYLEESDLARVSAGASALFYPDGSSGRPLELTVERIDRNASRTLSEAVLSSAHGGEVPVHVTRELQVPDRAIYGVTLAVRDSRLIEAVRQLRGHVVIRAQSRTLAGRYFETAAAVTIRELGW
jgi:putative peptide zinc metalloprotease protein